MFLTYMNKDRLTARILDHRGKTFVMSVASSVPMRALTCPARLVTVELEHVWVYPLE